MVHERSVERPRVVLASPAPSVWRRAVLRYLDASPSLDFSTVSPEPEACLADIERLQPDWVVLLAEKDSLDCSPPLADVFEVAPRATVMLICRWANNVRVHRCEQFQLSRPEDLIDLITRDTTREAFAPVAASLGAENAPPAATGTPGRSKPPAG